MIICPCSITPHDWTLTLVSVCVIFLCLILLFAVYSLMGKYNTGKAERKRKKSGAASPARPAYEEEGIHDIESGIITIESAGGGSSARMTSRAAGNYGNSTASSSEGLIKSPLPGVVLKVFVKEGQDVKKGDKIVVLEAMKMENDILSDKEGVVVELKVAPGDSVLEGAEIAKIG